MKLCLIVIMLLISEKHVMLIESITVVILSMNAVEEENLLKHIPVTAVKVPMKRFFFLTEI